MVILVAAGFYVFTTYRATGGVSIQPAPSDFPVIDTSDNGTSALSPSVVPPAGFPNAANTGVPAGVTLKRAGSIQVSRAGAVISGYEVAGTIDVVADNVVIRNVRLTNAAGAEWGIIQRKGTSGLVIEDTDIIGNGKQQMQAAVLNYGGALTVRRVDISRASDGIATVQGLIEESYLHDPSSFDTAHVDMIQATSGPPADGSLIIRHNSIVNNLPQTSAIALFQDFGVARNTLVERNLIAGGGWSIYGGYGPEKSYNIRIINNVFGRQIFANGGYNGPVAYFDKDGSGNQFSGNVWSDTGAALTDV